jgi:O-antigen/teichoic acid export membrane protein
MSSDKLVGIAVKAARGGLFLFVGNALSTIILAIGAIVVARLLGPADYGRYALTLVLPALLVSLADAGMNPALVRFSARLRSEGDYEASNKAIKLGFLLKLFLSIAAFLICYFGADIIATTVLNRPGLASYLQLAGLLIIFQAIFDAASSSFVGMDLMQYSAGIQIIFSLLKSTLAPALVLFGLGIGGAIVGYIVGFVVAGAVGATILFTKYTRSIGEVVPECTVKLSALLDYSLPLYVATILTVFLTQYQNIVLARFANNIEVGNFNAAWNFTSLLSILIYPISTAIFPMFSKMNPESQRNDLTRGFVLAVKYVSLTLIPASVAVMVFSQDLVLLTYGNGYVLAPQYLAIVSALYLLAGIGLYVIGNFLNGVAATRTYLRINALTLAIYLPLGPALTWFWGPYGLLIAYITSYTASTLYGVRKVSVNFHARPDLKSSARIFLASLVAAIPSAALSQFNAAGVVNLVAGGCLFLFTYLTMAPILGAVMPQDINNLETILCRTRAAAIILRPVLAYETRILSALGRQRPPS